MSQGEKGEKPLYCPQKWQCQNKYVCTDIFFYENMCISELFAVKILATGSHSCMQSSETRLPQLYTHTPGLEHDRLDFRSGPPPSDDIFVCSPKWEERELQHWFYWNVQPVCQHGFVLITTKRKGMFEAINTHARTPTHKHAHTHTQHTPYLITCLERRLLRDRFVNTNLFVFFFLAAKLRVEARPCRPCRVEDRPSDGMELGTHPSRIIGWGSGLPHQACRIARSANCQLRSQVEGSASLR